MSHRFTSGWLKNKKSNKVVAFSIGLLSIALLTLVSFSLVNAQSTNSNDQTPVYTCDQLYTSIFPPLRVDFSARYTASNGATYQSTTYNFGDGNSVTTTNNDVSYTYSKYGMYTATATVNFLVNGEQQSVTSSNCTIGVYLLAPPVVSDQCTSLNLTVLTPSTHTIEADIDFKAVNLTLIDVNYDFGDGSSTILSYKNQSTLVTHSYANYGSYNVTATLRFGYLTQKGWLTASCNASVSLDQPVVTPTPALAPLSESTAPLPMFIGK